MSIQSDIRERVAALSATLPQDADPLAEARAEQRAENAYAERIDYGEHPELIEVGMGATMRTGMGGLYRAYTVIEVQRGGKLLRLQEDKVIRGGTRVGWEDNDDKTFEPDPRGRIETVSLRKDGTFVGKGAPLVWYATRYFIGHRRDWTDYSQ